MMLKTALLGTDSSNSSDLSKYSPSPNAPKIRHKIILTEALLMSADVPDNSLVAKGKVVVSLRRQIFANLRAWKNTAPVTTRDFPPHQFCYTIKTSNKRIPVHLSDEQMTYRTHF